MVQLIQVREWLRQHGAITSVMTLAAISLLFSAVVPAPSTKVEIDSQRDVNEALCIPWISDAFPTNRTFAVGYSDGNKSSALVRLGSDTQSVEPASLLALPATREIPELLVEGVAAKYLATDLWASTSKGLAIGAAAAKCQAPAQDWWFVGIDTTAGHSASLVLANPDNEDVIVSLAGFTANGEYVEATDRRILVRADSRAIVDLALAYPAQSSLAIHAHLAEGRISTIVEAWSVSGPSALGRSFITPMSTPVTSGVIAGARDQSRNSVLHIMATDEDAVVSVRLATRGGGSTLAAADKIGVEAGKVVTVDLAPVISDIATALIIESSHPIIAAVRQIARVGSATDLEVQTLQAPILQRGSLLLVEPTYTHDLVMYAESSAEVAIAAYAKGKLVWSSKVTVNPTTTTLVSLPSDKIGSAVVVIETSAKIWMTHWRYTSIGTSAAVSVGEETAQLVPGTSLEVSLS